MALAGSCGSPSSSMSGSEAYSLGKPASCLAGKAAGPVVLLASSGSESPEVDRSVSVAVSAVSWTWASAALDGAGAEASGFTAYCGVSGEE